MAVSIVIHQWYKIDSPYGVIDLEVCVLGVDTTNAIGNERNSWIVSIRRDIVS